MNSKNYKKKPYKKYPHKRLKRNFGLPNVRNSLMHLTTNDKIDYFKLKKCVPYTLATAG